MFAPVVTKFALGWPFEWGLPTQPDVLNANFYWLGEALLRFLDLQTGLERTKLTRGQRRERRSVSFSPCEVPAFFTQERSLERFLVGRCLPPPPDYFRNHFSTGSLNFAKSDVVGSVIAHTVWEAMGNAIWAMLFEWFFFFTACNAPWTTVYIESTMESFSTLFRICLALSSFLLTLYVLKQLQ
ncbi:hypothetical protein CYMTET_27818, partial [Cymbomonas tetramitiformis]